MKIRIGTFETNSSSTHSIVIPKNVELDFDQEISNEFHFQTCYCFGWGPDSYNAFMDKLSYLMYCYVNLYKDEPGIQKAFHLNKYDDEIIDELLLTEENTKNTVFKNLFLVLSEYTKSDSLVFVFFNDFYEGYVENAYEYAADFKYIMDDSNLLRNFLFSSMSSVYTDNDNY